MLNKWTTTLALMAGVQLISSAAQAEILSIDGTTVGGPKYSAPFADASGGNGPYGFGTNVSYSAFTFTAENTATYRFSTYSYGFAGITYLYSSFNPANSKANLLAWSPSYDGRSLFNYDLVSGATYTFVNSAFLNSEAGSFYTLIVANLVTPPVPAVPEPETYAMLLAGLGLVGAIARRKRMAV